MCVSNQIPRERIKERLPEVTKIPKGKDAPVSKTQDWIEGYKVLRRIKEGKHIVLKSAMAEDEWKPGLMVAKKPKETGFSGGLLPNNEFGFHILRVKPMIDGKEDETVARIFFHADSVVTIGEDSAGSAQNVETVVAKIVDFRKKDYEAALKGGSRISKNIVKQVQAKMEDSKKLPIDKAVKIAKPLTTLTRESFVAVAKQFGVTVDYARSLYSQVKLRLQAKKILDKKSDK